MDMYIVSILRLSLLTMTNPNQMHEVLLFVSSNMADETDFSSKLPTADRTRKVWGRQLCWYCLSSGFPLITFLLDFPDSFCFVFTSTLLMRPRQFDRLFVICSHEYVSMLKSLRLWGCPCIAAYDHRGSVFPVVVLQEEFLWQTFIRHYGNMACPS